MERGADAGDAVTRRAPLLVIGVGNPSRGDDAVGPLFVERLGELLRERVERGELELLTDFQLQIEHALDLTGRARVVFVDASVSAHAPFTYERVEAARDATHTSHAMSPAAVLDTHRRVVGEPPESWILAIRGERFELGEALGEGARRGLDAAVAFFVEHASAPAPSGHRIEVSGVVQGVGFRPWVVRTARALGITGRVYNTSSGVVIEAFGGRGREALMTALREAPPPAARVERISCEPIAWQEHGTFVVDPSVAEDGSRGALPLPADLAACGACLAEVDDPHDRHCGYAFTSCTDCGPRYSIVTELPYDRARTTMAGFAPCPACAAEYADVEERRYHAQTLACPHCGPRLWLADGHGAVIEAPDPVGAAAQLLLAGKVIAIRGLGAFHLACDATSDDAVRTLRARKRRDAKPLAVMVPGLAEAEALGWLDDTARSALTQPARPIVLVPRRESAVCREVFGPSRRIGLLLPYTPLHHLLMAHVGRALVMTSGNLSGEPVVIDCDEAIRTLGPLSDALLLHDRPIVRRVEDSVVRCDGGSTRVIRRARGYAPRHIALPAAAPEPILAVGGHLKNTVCVVIEDRAYPSSHLGDLESVESEHAWTREVESLCRLLRVQPQVVAHDLHPDYVPTRVALGMPARVRHGVQHHAAHVLSAIAELHLEGPVIGVAYDGSGWGDDGTAWGGEILWVSGREWQRLASFRPLPLPGGETAIREVWRQAYSLLRDAFGEAARALARRFACFAGIEDAALHTLDRMIDTGVRVVPARGVGRAFDAVGALALGLERAGFEGHVAIALEEAAAQGRVEPYPWGAPRALAASGPVGAEHEIDLRPTTRALARELLDGVPGARVAARFHETVICATEEVVRRALALRPAAHVVLTGGALQNRILEAGLRARLGEPLVRMARELPLNDGGLALGQAWSAVLALRA